MIGATFMIVEPKKQSSTLRIIKIFIRAPKTMRKIGYNLGLDLLRLVYTIQMFKVQGEVGNFKTCEYTRSCWE